MSHPLHDAAWRRIYAIVEGIYAEGTKRMPVKCLLWKTGLSMLTIFSHTVMVAGTVVVVVVFFVGRFGGANAVLLFAFPCKLNDEWVAMVCCNRIWVQLGTCCVDWRRRTGDKMFVWGHTLQKYYISKTVRNIIYIYRYRYCTLISERRYGPCCMLEVCMLVLFLKHIEDLIYYVFISYDIIVFVRQDTNRSFMWKPDRFRLKLGNLKPCV